MSISIIIPAWNEEKIILNTFDYLRKLKIPLKYSEIIFVAGGNDNTYKTCKEANLSNFNEVNVIKQVPGDFKSGALIKGMKKAKGNIITLIDADVFVAPNLVIEIAAALKKFDAVCCDFIPMIASGFWRDYYTIFKKNWSKNPDNLGSLIGGATISLKREIIEEIGVNNFFSKKSKAGVDYYMGLVLKHYNKHIGFVKKTRSLMPRPNNLKDFIKDQRRWLNAFYSIHHDDKSVILTTLFFNIFFCLFPPLILLSSFKKLQKIGKISHSKMRCLLILFFVEFVINFMSLSAFVKKMTGTLKDLGHFKSEDRYLS